MDIEKQKKLDAIWGSPVPVKNPQMEAGKQRAQELRERAKATRKETRKENRSVGEKILDFTGGKEIAQGLGQGLANTGFMEKGGTILGAKVEGGNVAKQLEETQASQFKIQNDLITRIKEKKTKGEDTSRLENALKMIEEDVSETAQGAERLLNPNELTTKQVLGDALQLATTAGGAKLAGSMVGKTGQAIGTVKGALAGAKAGVVTGGAVGTLGGASQGLQEDKDLKGIAESALAGGLIGAGTGGVLGALGGAVSGKIQAKRFSEQTLRDHLKTAKMELQEMSADEIKKLGGKSKLFEANKQDIILQLRSEGLNRKADILEKTPISSLKNFDEYEKAMTGAFKNYTKQTEQAIKSITPKTKDLTPKEYERLVQQGRISPKQGRTPDKYILSDRELDTATKYQKLLGKDPVKNTQNLAKEISSKDKEVGAFLRKNNGIFNTGELKNSIAKKLEQVDDLTVDEARLAKLKESTIDNFIKSLEKNDMETLWKARKAFDRKIESAFRGSPTLQKEIKKEFRNAVQDFISERTDDVTYKGYMQEMSDLINLSDTTALKAAKERGLNEIEKWIKNNPVEAKVLGWVAGSGVVTGAVHALGR